MNRIVFWLAVIGLGYLVWRFVKIVERKQQARRGRDDDESQGNRAGGDAGGGAGGSAGSRSGGRTARQGGAPERLARGEPMVRCAHCGIYLPGSEALERAGQVYCSAEHREAGRVTPADKA